MFAKTITELKVADEFVDIKRIDQRGKHGGELPPMSVCLMGRGKAHVLPVVSIRIGAGLLRQLRWLKGDRIHTRVAPNTRRAMLLRSKDASDYTLQRGGKDSTNASGYLRITVRDEPTRALLPTNGRKEYVPAFKVDEEGSSLLFDLDK